MGDKGLKLCHLGMSLLGRKLFWLCIPIGIGGGEMGHYLSMKTL